MIPKFFLMSIANLFVFTFAGFASFDNPWLLLLVIVSFLNIIRELNIGTGKFVLSEKNDG